MRILHVLNTLSDRGNGIVNLAVDLAIEQQRSGHTVGIVAGLGGYEDLVRAAGVQVLTLDQSRGGAKIALTSLQCRGVLRRFKPDVVHAHMQTGLLLFLPWTRLYRIPLIGHLHNVHDKTARRMGLADRLITVSAAVAEDMRRQGVVPGKLRVVLNGNLRSPRVPAVSTLAVATLARPAVTTIAGMNHRKGIAELLEAFETVAAQVPDAHLYLVGDGPERVLFEEQTSHLAARERIHFEGFRPSPQSYMLASDVFVLASRRDSCPLVLAEAREAGCAIVASDVDGIPEALDDGRAGVLVPPQSPGLLAEAILGLLKDDAVRRNWQERARTGLERFSVVRMAQDVLNVYQELVAERAGGGAAAGRVVSLSAE